MFETWSSLRQAKSDMLNKNVYYLSHNEEFDTGDFRILQDSV
jgi:hypothetical protein